MKKQDIDFEKYWFLSKNMTDSTIKYMLLVVKKLESMGALEEIDYGALSILAQNYDLYLLASDDVRKNGLISTTAVKGGVKVNPCIEIGRAAAAQAVKIMNDFGLMVKSRQGIKKLQEEDETSPLMQFISKHNK